MVSGGFGGRQQRLSTFNSRFGGGQPDGTAPPAEGRRAPTGAPRGVAGGRNSWLTG